MNRRSWSSLVTPESTTTSTIEAFSDPRMMFGFASQSHSTGIPQELHVHVVEISGFGSLVHNTAACSNNAEDPPRK